MNKPKFKKGNLVVLVNNYSYPGHSIGSLLTIQEPIHRANINLYRCELYPILFKESDLELWCGTKSSKNKRRKKMNRKLTLGQFVDMDNRFIDWFQQNDFSIKEYNKSHNYCLILNDGNDSYIYFSTTTDKLLDIIKEYEESGSEVEAIFDLKKKKEVHYQIKRKLVIVPIKKQKKEKYNAKTGKCPEYSQS